jgi:CheY-like chemotaxis protein
MRISDLDVRKIASKDISITAEDYLKKISELLEHILEALDSLNRIAEKRSDEGDMNRLFELRRDLEDVGCNVFTKRLDNVLCAIASARDIQKFAKDLAAFYKRVANVQNISKSLLGEEGPFDPAYADLLKKPLYGALAQLDKREADRKLQILAVDDTAFMLKSISSILGDIYKVYTLTKPDMVEMLLDHVVPELFLLDYKMPVMSGLELIPVIRSRSEHATTPIIFLTAMGTDEHFSNAISSGVCDYIIKPFKNEVLVKKISKHIVRKKTF